jgi:hypothetical protein
VRRDLAAARVEASVVRRHDKHALDTVGRKRLGDRVQMVLELAV